jgi:hypothetical protein
MKRKGKEGKTCAFFRAQAFASYGLGPRPSIMGREIGKTERIKIRLRKHRGSPSQFRFKDKKRREAPKNNNGYELDLERTVETLLDLRSEGRACQAS